MTTKQAAEIRKGITEARRRPVRGLLIFNSRHYSSLAVAAFNEYRHRHTHYC